jgi:hypothetical protein
MLRTRSRPLPSGRVRPAEAVVFGALLTATGLATLLWRCGALATTVAFLTWASYLFAYTPLKRRTPLATLVGSVPGALPPVIGWTAASGRLDAGALILFAILFLWQIPHFLAIAWLYRDDYARAGFPMLPVLDREGSFTGRQAVVHSLALLLVSLAPAATGLAGPTYAAGALFSTWRYPVRHPLSRALTQSPPPALARVGGMPPALPPRGGRRDLPRPAHGQRLPERGLLRRWPVVAHPPGPQRRTGRDARRDRDLGLFLFTSSNTPRSAGTSPADLRAVYFAVS